MTTTRRKILKIGGASILIAAAGGTGWSLTRAPKLARQPWHDAGQSFGDPRLDILAYAILAPNPHNMQPWQIALDDDNGFTVLCDPTRLLPETDPPNRQITIGFGCFLELVRQAAAERGLMADVTTFPSGEPQPRLDERPIAHVRLMKDGLVQKDPLFGGIISRRTNRAPYDLANIPKQKAIDTIVIESGEGVNADSTIDPKRVDDLKHITRRAWEIEWGIPETRRESIVVSRIGKKEINAQPWGLAMAGPFMEFANNMGMLTQEDMDIAGTTSYDETLAYYNRACDTATGYVWTTTATNTRLDQLNAGRAWVRMQLAANAQGIAFHPLSQALQEFPEMAGPYSEIHELLAEKGHTVQMLTRIGYAKPPPAAPREPLTAKLIDA